MRKDINFALVIIILIISNCTPKNIVKAYKQSASSDVNQISGIDDNSKIQWRIANDNKKLYFRFESSDQTIKRMLLHNGFTIILDTTGGKNENIILNVSNHSETDNQVIKFDPKLFKPNTSGTFKEVYLKEEDSEMLIDLQFEKSDFSATYTIDSFNLIVCNVVIPLTAIQSNGLGAIKNLSMCLKIERGQKPQHRDGEEPSGDEENGGFDASFGGSGRIGGVGMNRGGMEGGMGGMNGGMGRSGMGGSRRGGGGTNGGSGNSGTSNVDFWFLTELAK
jgi:hypothetical protein